MAYGRWTPLQQIATNPKVYGQHKLDMMEGKKGDTKLGGRGMGAWIWKELAESSVNIIKEVLGAGRL